MNVEVDFNHLRRSILCLLLLLVMVASRCSKGTSTSNPTPPSVEAAEVQQRDVPIYGEWIGTLDGLVNADIKAEVSGYNWSSRRPPFARSASSLHPSLL